MENQTNINVSDLYYGVYEKYEMPRESTTNKLVPTGDLKIGVFKLTNETEDKLYYEDLITGVIVSFLKRTTEYDSYGVVDPSFDLKINAACSGLIGLNKVDTYTNKENISYEEFVISLINFTRNLEIAPKIKEELTQFVYTLDYFELINTLSSNASVVKIKS